MVIGNVYSVMVRHYNVVSKVSPKFHKMLPVLGRHNMLRGRPYISTEKIFK